MSELPLSTSGSAVADANGVATVELRAAIAGEWWRLRNTTISGNSQNEAAFKMYRGFVGEQFLIGASMTGNLDSAHGDDYIPPGVAVVCQWTNATPGSVFTVTIDGVRGRNGVF